MMIRRLIRAKRMVYAVFGVMLSLGVGAWLFQYQIGSIEAAIAPSPCPGNVCTGTLVVGGQAVNYAYTQHIRSDGTLKVRLNGGAYNTSQLVSFIIFDAPQFASWDKNANPTNGAVFLPQEDVNPGRTAYERRDSDGCTSCIIDQVMEVTYSGLSTGVHTFSLSVIQNGDSGGKNGLKFYVDAGSPPNDDESVVWGSILNMDYPCADGIDNDLSFYGDCADSACAGSVGDVGSGAICEITEFTCHDEFDNDADGLIDCLDPNCDGKAGRQVPSVALCQFGNEYGLNGCGDVFDNDGDGYRDCEDNTFVAPGTVTNTCWKQIAYGCPAVENCTTGEDDDKDKSYDDAWDFEPLTGVNCLDYDC
ncbi:hypothetical protein ACFLZO_01480, partial [Patescibacteria group bacterium]